MPTPKLLTLKSPTARGELLWDPDTGTFTGTDADMLNDMGDEPIGHVAFPVVEGSPRKDAKALIIALHILGWDCPDELMSELREIRAGQGAVPSGHVV